MGYLTAKQFSEIWGITERRIIKLCKENRINGAEKNGMVWIIPENTLKPSDKRCNTYKYINVEKKIMIVNCIDELQDYLKEKLYTQGYIVEYCIENELNKNDERYYEGLIYFSKKNKSTKEENCIKDFCKKLNFESSIVSVKNTKDISTTMVKELEEDIGLRINTLVLDIKENDVDINYEEIADDIINLLLDFKNTTGAYITTTGGKIEVDKNMRTKNLKSGEFYKVINNYFKRLNSSSYLWCASTMLEDEWTEDPQEMKFRILNLAAANRGTRIDRIFMFSKNKIKDFKNNKTLKIYMQSNINTMYVDYDEVLEKNPKLIEIVGAGWDGINQDTLIADISNNSEERGYVSKNTNEIMKAYNCFQELKKYAVKLKDILK